MHNDESSSLSPRNPRVMSSWSVRSTISGGKRFSNGNEDKRLEQQLTLVSIFTIHGDKKHDQFTRSCSKSAGKSLVDEYELGEKLGKREEGILFRASSEPVEGNVDFRACVSPTPPTT